MPALVDAAGSVLLEGGLFAAILGHDEIPWLGRFVRVNDDEIAFFKEGFHRLATQPEAETTRADIHPRRHILDVAIEGRGLFTHLVPVAGLNIAQHRHARTLRDHGRFDVVISGHHLWCRLSPRLPVSSQKPVNSDPQRCR
ncbi:hypothetical protein D3C72_1725450 [compost metagenome]